MTVDVEDRTAAITCALVRLADLCGDLCRTHGPTRTTQSPSEEDTRMKSEWTQCFLVIYSGVLTAVFAASTISGCAAATRKASFDEIDVQRINVIEPDGTPRLVISNMAKFPGSFFNGKEARRPDRSTTGLLFMNDEGTEMGGLIFDGAKSKDGRIESSGHLSFDQYDQDQLFAIDADQEGATKSTTLVISDRGNYSLHGALDEILRMKSLPQEQRRAAMKEFAATHPGDHERVVLGRAPDKSAILRMKDAEGRDRIVMKVVSEGAAVLQFLDENGRVIDQLPRKSGAGR
jgi:hypothetical protein